MDSPQRVARGPGIWMSIMVAGMVVLLGGLFSASPAWAHGAGETEEGYLLVQQALSHLAHDKTSSGIDLSMEKIGDVLKTKDQEGVNVAEVRQAEAALEAGQVAKAQALLQHSISQAVSNLEPAIGEQTGTTLVLDPMPGRGSLRAEDLGFLVMSVLLLLIGAGLAWRFRPPDSVRALRRRLQNLADQVTLPPETPTEFRS